MSVKPLNRIIKNGVCFVYQNATSKRMDIEPESELTVINISKGGDYTVLINGKKKDIDRVTAKLIMVYE